jgi:hypothetical protein
MGDRSRTGALSEIQTVSGRSTDHPKRLLIVLGALGLLLVLNASAQAQAMQDSSLLRAVASAEKQQTSGSDTTPIAQRVPLHIPRVSTPPGIEDYLDGKSRPEELKVTGFKQREPQDGVPVTQDTAAYLSYDDKHLYVIFVCKDEPGKVRAHMSKRENIGNDDTVGIAIDTFHDQRRAYLFATNPLGVQLDGITTEGQNDDMSFDTLWRSDGKLTADGYVVWMSIPFKSLRFHNADVQTWGIGLLRSISRNNENAWYPYITRRVQGFAQQLADLEGLNKISPGRNIQIIPYGFFARARFLDPVVPQLKTNTEFRGGVDAKIVFHDSFTLDATVNPDFSQVESDEPQVIINQRFEVFFPEKRPFFLENSGYFVTPETLFFSRRIIDPQLGLRLTGKAAGWEIAGLAIDDRAPGKQFEAGDRLRGERAGIGVVRIQHELPNQSSIGMIATSRDFASSSNRVFGIDGRWKLNKTWVLTGQAIESYTRQLDGERFSGSAFNVSVSQQTRHFQEFFNYTDRSPDFHTDLGFVPRVDIRDLSNFATYRWRPKKGRVQAFGPNLYTEAIWDHKGNLQDWRINMPFQIDFAGNTSIFVRRAEFAESFAGIRFREHTNDLNLYSGFLNWLSFYVNVTTGVGVNFFPAEGLPFSSNVFNSQTGFTLRPSSRFSLDQTYIYDRLATRKDHFPEGDSKTAVIFNNHILRSKINYQFNRALSLRAIFDYNSVLPNERLVALDRDKRFTADFLMTYLVNPGTALYVGYTDGYQNLAIAPGIPPSLIRTDAPVNSIGRQVFVKVSYLLRF